MITRETHRFVIRQYASEVDALWVKRGLVRPTDIDCTEMDSDTFSELYQAMRDESTHKSGDDADESNNRTSTAVCPSHDVRRTDAEEAEVVWHLSVL